WVEIKTASPSARGRRPSLGALPPELGAGVTAGRTRKLLPSSETAISLTVPRGSRARESGTGPSPPAPPRQEYSRPPGPSTRDTGPAAANPVEAGDAASAAPLTGAAPRANPTRNITAGRLYQPRT